MTVGDGDLSLALAPVEQVPLVMYALIPPHVDIMSNVPHV